jgi:hypothetical protein
LTENKVVVLIIENKLKQENNISTIPKLLNEKLTDKGDKKFAFI